MSEIRILGIHVLDRIKESGRTQLVLSKYAENIKTRWGFHELTESTCSRTGFVIVELTGKPTIWDQLEAELNEIGGINVKHMSFTL